MLASCAETVPERIRAADQEQAFLAKQSQAIKKFLIGMGIRQRRSQPRREFVLIRHGPEETRIDEPVHDLRLPCQHVAETRCSAENERDQGYELFVLTKQRNQSAAALQRLQKTVERHDRIIRLFSPGQPADETGDKFLEGLAGRVHLEHTILAGDPSLNGLGRESRFLEAEIEEMIDKPLIFGAATVVDVRRCFGVGITFKQSAGVALHAIQVGQQILREIITVAVSKEPGKPLDSFRIGGKRMGLFVSNHLQTVLDAAQESIGGR